MPILGPKSGEGLPGLTALVPQGQPMNNFLWYQIQADFISNLEPAPVFAKQPVKCLQCTQLIALGKEDEFNARFALFAAADVVCANRYKTLDDQIFQETEPSRFLRTVLIKKLFLCSRFFFVSNQVCTANKKRQAA